MASYFRARDEFEPVTRDELLDPCTMGRPLPQLERRLTKLPSDQERVAYCGEPRCALSFEAAALLHQLGCRTRRLEDFPMENGWAADLSAGEQQHPRGGEEDVARY